MVIVFGSVNLDLIFRVPALPAPGQTLMASEFRMEPGGKGANQAAAAAWDGAEVVFAGAIGRDSAGSQATAGLRSAGVDISRIRQVGGASGCAAITVDDEGRNHVVVAAGANLLAKAAQVEDSLLGPGKTLVLQLETDLAENAALIARARARGTRILLNFAPIGALAHTALREVDILVVNEDEAAWLAADLGTGATAADLAAKLDITVVRTLGAAGLEAAGILGGKSLAAKAVTAIDTTAAGDCFVGVLAAGLDRGLPWEGALARANVAAALCCTRPGTQGSLPTRAETDAACRP